jgi:hypothetical protein
MTGKNNVCKQVDLKMPLAKWLKVDQRLSELLHSLKEKISQANELSAACVLGETQLAAIQAKREELIKNLKILESLQDAKAHIREEIARTNAGNGVSASLARIQLLKDRMEIFNSVIEFQESCMLSIPELERLVKQEKNNRVGFKSLPNEASEKSDEDFLFREFFANENNYGRDKGLKIRVLDAKEIEELKANLEDIDLEAFELKSCIAESNAELVTITVSAEVARYFQRK